jgi:cyclohexa-1,5-dienecarbonyl-CoA hydratase
VTAAIGRGRCLGGGFELALACDFIFAATDATLGLPEIALGAFPPAACALLPARVGTARASVAVVTGEARSAADWQTAGLIERTAPADRLEAEVERWFDAYLQPRSGAALRSAIRAARLALIAGVDPVLTEAERIYLDELVQTHDAAEGVAAFLEKRQPKWTDN